MFTAPSVNDLGGHFKLMTVLTPIFDQRTEVIDQLAAVSYPTCAVPASVSWFTARPEAIAPASRAAVAPLPFLK